MNSFHTFFVWNRITEIPTRAMRQVNQELFFFKGLYVVFPYYNRFRMQLWIVRRNKLWNASRAVSFRMRVHPEEQGKYWYSMALTNLNISTAFSSKAGLCISPPILHPPVYYIYNPKCHLKFGTSRANYLTSRNRYLLLHFFLNLSVHARLWATISEKICVKCIIVVEHFVR